MRLEHSIGPIDVEVQLSPDPRKRYVWPVYAANLRAQLEYPVLVLARQSASC